MGAGGHGERRDFNALLPVNIAQHERFIIRPRESETRRSICYMVVRHRNRTVSILYYYIAYTKT